MGGRAHERITGVAVVMQPRAGSVSAAIDELLGALPGAGLPAVDATVAAAVRERESQASTYFSHGVALPHARCGPEQPWVLAFGRFAGGIPWGADSERAHLVFLSLIPASASTDYLRFLQKLGRAIRDEAVRRQLETAAEQDSARRWIHTHLGAR